MRLARGRARAKSLIMLLLLLRRTGRGLSIIEPWFGGWWVLEGGLGAAGDGDRGSGVGSGFCVGCMFDAKIG